MLVLVPITGVGHTYALKFELRVGLELPLRRNFFVRM